MMRIRFREYDTAENLEKVFRYMESQVHIFKGTHPQWLFKKSYQATKYRIVAIYKKHCS